MAKEYSNIPALNDLIEQAVGTIEQGRKDGLVEMIKNSPTYILKASPNHKETRYRVGEQLVTYNAIGADGKPVKETYKDGKANVESNSVILRNAEPIKNKDGQEVKGFYEKDGTFVPDQEKGIDVLFNEYVSNVDFVKTNYGVQPKEEWQKGVKLQPSYILEIPSEMKDVTIKSNSGAEIKLTGGDYVVIDSKKGKVSSVHGCERSWLNKTYVSLEEQLKTIGATA